jgi:hypothetical protein
VRSQALARSRAFFMRNESKFAHLDSCSVGESSFMRASSGTPSIVPHSEEHDVYVVEHDPGPPGSVWAEVESEASGFEPVVMDLLTGRYTKPVRVVVFNVAGGWCRDASVEVAHELRRRCDLQASRHSVFPAGLRGSLRGPLSRRSAPLADAPVLAQANGTDGAFLVGDGGTFSHPSPPGSLPTSRERRVQDLFMMQRASHLGTSETTEVDDGEVSGRV